MFQKKHLKYEFRLKLSPNKIAQFIRKTKPISKSEQSKHEHQDRWLRWLHVLHGNENRLKLLYILVKRTPKTRRIKTETEARMKISDYNHIKEKYSTIANEK